MPNDFDDLTKTLGALTNNFTAASLAKMNSKASKIPRRENARRIRANITPDGNSMPARKKAKIFAPKSAIKFLYPEHGTGKPRLVFLIAWTMKKGIIIGFDEKSGGVRHFLKSKITRYLPCSTPAKPFKDKSIKEKSGKMFKKLPSPQFFKTKSNAQGFRIGFTQGRTSQIAPLHHFGNKRVNLPERPLLGINENDADLILEEYIKQIDF